MKKSFKIITGALGIIMLLALIVSIPQVSQPVANMVGSTAEKVTDIAKTVLFIAIGLFLISSGVAAMALPVIGVTLVVVGLGLLAYSIIPMFRKDKPAE